MSERILFLVCVCGCGGMIYRAWCELADERRWQKMLDDHWEER